MPTGRKMFLQLSTHKPSLAWVSLENQNPMALASGASKGIELSSNDEGALVFVVANGSYTANASVTLQSLSLENELIAYPNPLSVSRGDSLHLLMKQSAASTSIDIINEYGKIIVSVNHSNTNQTSAIDLIDAQGQKLFPGTYYLRHMGHIKTKLVVTQ